LLFVQILEEGEVIDTMGKRADFRNAVVVLTASGSSSVQGYQPKDTIDNEHSQLQQIMVPIPQTDPVSPTSPPNNQIPIGDNTMSAASEHAPNNVAHRSAAALSLPPEEPPVMSPKDHAPKGHPPGPRRREESTVPEDVLRLIDATACFKVLETEDLLMIARSLVDENAPALAEQGASLEVTDAALRVVVDHAQAAGGGASTLHTAVRSVILGPVVEELVIHCARQMQGGGGDGSGMDVHGRQRALRRDSRDGRAGARAGRG